MRQLAKVTILSAAIGALIAACGATDGGKGDTQLGGGSGSGQGGSGVSGSGSGAAGRAAPAQSRSTLAAPAAAPDRQQSTAAAPAFSSAAESVVVYEPIALFIMQDRSGSMVTGIPLRLPNSWPNSVSALQRVRDRSGVAGFGSGPRFLPADQ